MQKNEKHIMFSSPQFADKCDKWEDFSSRDWDLLLQSQPELITKKLRTGTGG